MAPEPIMQGFMLKKKRKKMQGMARRYVSLSATGALSYSFNPTSPIRDSVFVSLAYVSASRKQRTFHIDSGRTVMHFKALSEGDFDRWTEALRTFVGTVQERQPSKGQGQRATAIVAGGPNQMATTVDLVKIFGAVARMTAPIQELETVCADLKLHDLHLSTPSPHANSSSPKFKFLKKQGRQDDYFDIKPTAESLVKQLGQALAAIKSQHDILAQTLNTIPQLGAINASSPTGGMRTYASRSSAYAPRPPSSTSSSFSVDSGETDDYYEDAVPGEFVLEDEASEEEEDESEVEEEVAGDTSFARLDEDESYGHARGDERASEATTIASQGVVVQRRAQLPAPVTGDEFSMLSMLRKNVGKDLSTISFPVTFNEPLSALQRIAEEFEYSDLLHRAAATTDSIERLTLVATFAISGSSGNKYRSTRKPFNPLLGETYECIRPDKGFKFVSEKVSHQPVVMAFHAEAPAWQINGHVAPSQKFWGRSMEVFVHGDFNVTFTDTEDTFSIRKPSSFVRNLVAGTKFLEVVGDMFVSNESTGEKAVIAFKEGSAWGGISSRNKIEGRICDARGSTKVELVGRWDECVDRKEGRDNFQRLWQIDEFPPNAERYYGFSTFAVQLNETTTLENGSIPRTDSRLRPDQLALERGDVDEAEAEKKRVEEKQRAKRKTMVDAGQVVTPRFFVSNGEGWKYAGQYFEKREKHAFVDPGIF